MTIVLSVHGCRNGALFFCLMLMMVFMFYVYVYVSMRGFDSLRCDHRLFQIGSACLRPWFAVVAH